LTAFATWVAWALVSGVVEVVVDEACGDSPAFVDVALLGPLEPHADRTNAPKLSTRRQTARETGTLPAAIIIATLSLPTSLEHDCQHYGVTIRMTFGRQSEVGGLPGTSDTGHLGKAT
jgi:hypothetical protein